MNEVLNLSVPNFSVNFVRERRRAMARAGGFMDFVLAKISAN